MASDSPGRAGGRPPAGRSRAAGAAGGLGAGSAAACAAAGGQKRPIKSGNSGPPAPSPPSPMAAAARPPSLPRRRPRLALASAWRRSTAGPGEEVYRLEALLQPRARHFASAARPAGEARREQRCWRVRASGSSAACQRRRGRWARRRLRCSPPRRSAGGGHARDAASLTRRGAAAAAWEWCVVGVARDAACNPPMRRSANGVGLKREGCLWRAARGAAAVRLRRVALRACVADSLARAARRARSHARAPRMR